MRSTPTKRFVSQQGFPWREEFADLVPGSDAFSDKWREIAEKQPVAFQKAQHGYIKETHFDKLVMNIRTDEGVDITTRSRALQNVIWSTAVQHGPNARVVQRALAAIKTGDQLNLADPAFDEKLIKAIYAERGRKNEQGELAYFSRNSRAVQDGVAKRFVNEEQDALEMLASEQ